MGRILLDLDPRGYEDSSLGHSTIWDTRVHDLDVLWETLLFRHLKTWTDYHSDFEESPLRVKPERAPSQEV